MLAEEKRKAANRVIGVPNRNAPAGGGAQFTTGILYHNGTAGQGENQWQKKEKSKPAALEPKAAAPGLGANREQGFIYLVAGSFSETVPYPRIPPRSWALTTKPANACLYSGYEAAKAEINSWFVLSAS